MACKSSPKLRYTAYALCLVGCPVKIVAAAGGSAAISGALTSFDYRLPLIIAGWACIGLASFLMLRAKRELTAPAVCRARKARD